MLNDTLRKIMDSDAATAAVMSIEGFRALGKEKGDDLTPAEKKELSAEEKEHKSKRKQIQEKLIEFATRIPAFMYLTDFRENTLHDVITKLEPDFSKTVTGIESHEGLRRYGLYDTVVAVE